MIHGGNVWEGNTPAQWLDFSANLRPEGTPAWVMEVMQKALLNVRYYPERSVCSKVQHGLTVVGSLTKTLCIPGVRLGYICAVPEVIAELERRSLPWALGTLATEIASQLPEHMQELTEDAQRNAQRSDIGRANRLLYAASGLMLALIVLAAVIL